MIHKFETITDYLETYFDLNRIKTLPITDKFRLINYIKLVSSASVVAKDFDLKAIQKSEYYNMDLTFQLFISLLTSGMSADVLSDIVEFYCANFENSDIYYAKCIILGAGTLMIQHGVDRDSIISFLMILLGDDFLRNNFSRILSEIDHLDINSENEISIKYKGRDYTYRALKYDLLAMLKARHEFGMDRVRKIINTEYDNKDLKFYLTLLDLDNLEISDYIYHKLMKDSPKMDCFLMTAVRSMLQGMEIMETHYLLNALIGKYSEFDQPYSEVLKDIEVREKIIFNYE
ncbi:hypothetical protein [Fusibacter tunisiensis]|uniref:Uncharacterized protein n=1 Tax=Fusibacter tunisiensis TaxID=1008308 RepID=A0ABS2MNT7_9FIRM|nr:hypothetical protein [Fusibacter tunisiensis]MBM7561049.1 hypothetical protein [Fusibacter tunisiensis]